MKPLGLFVLFGLVIAKGATTKVCSEDKGTQKKIEDAINSGNLKKFKSLVQDANCVTRNEKQSPYVKGNSIIADKPVLYAAAHAGKKEIVEYLLDQGADVNQPLRITNVRKGKPGKPTVGHTPLFDAVQSGLLNIIKPLVEEGKANPSKKNGYRVSPFMAAVHTMNGLRNKRAMKKYKNIIHYLLENGADVKEKGNRNMTACQIAKKNRRMRRELQGKTMQLLCKK